MMLRDPLAVGCVVLAATVVPSSAMAHTQALLPALDTHYVIRVSLDPGARQLRGREQIRWRNTSGIARDELCLFLYYPSSGITSMGITTMGITAMGITSIRTDARDVNLLPSVSQVVSNRGTSPGRSVLHVPINPPVAPGSAVMLNVEWHTPLPSETTSTDFVLATRWFPQLADSREVPVFATFDVSIDVPDGWHVAASGREESFRRFVLPSGRTFAWAAGRGWTERRERVDRERDEPVDVRILLQREHLKHLAHLTSALRQALSSAHNSLAAYPYRELTLVDVPWGGSGSGQAFPAFLTIGMRWLDPRLSTDVETAMARLVARHFWEQIVGSDSASHPWMVDDFSTFAAGKLLDSLVRHHLASPSGDGFLVVRFFGGFVPYVVRSIRFNQATRPSAASPRAGLALSTLERYLGSPALDMILSDYASRFAFRRPRPEDFFKTAESVTGRDLSWFFDQVYGKSNEFDYAVERVTTRNGADGYRTAVTIGRNGDGTFSGTSRPRIGSFQSGRGLSVDIAFADGEVQRETWDGRDRSITYEYQSAAPVERVKVDARDVLRLDVKRTNNSWVRSSRSAAAANRWAAGWLTWLEGLLLTYALLA